MIHAECVSRGARCRPLDGLKLMLLHELTRTAGRRSLERIPAVAVGRARACAGAAIRLRRRADDAGQVSRSHRRVRSRSDLVTRAGRRDRLERLSRYALRPRSPRTVARQCRENDLPAAPLGGAERPTCASIPGAAGAARRVDAAAADQPDSLLWGPGPARRVAECARLGGRHTASIRRCAKCWSLDPQE